MAPVRSVEVPIRIPVPKDGEALPGAFAYDLRMHMAGKGEQTVAVGVRDDLGRTSSFLSKALPGGEARRDRLRAAGAGAVGRGWGRKAGAAFSPFS